MPQIRNREQIGANTSRNYTNIVQNGNFANGTTGWSGMSATLSVSSNTLIVTATGASTYSQIYQNTSYGIKPSNNIYTRLLVRVTNPNCVSIAIDYDCLPIGTDKNVYRISSPAQNSWYLVNIKNTPPSDSSGNFRITITHNYPDAATANGKVMEVKEVMAIDLTALGLDSLTVDQCNQRFPNWFGGTKSTLSPNSPLLNY